MNEIDAWLACDEDGEQWIFTEKPYQKYGTFFSKSGYAYIASGHDIPPGQCKPVKLRVEVVRG